jgi:hypothetical protein
MPEFPVGGICAVEHIPKSYFYVTENRLLPLYLEDRWLNTTPDTCIEVGSLFQMSREFNYMLFLVNEPIIRLLSTSFGGPTSYGYGPMNPKRVISSLSEGRLWDKMYLLRKDGSVLEGQTRHNFPVILEDLSSHRVVQFDEAPIGKDIGVWVYEMLPETDRNPNQSGAGVLPGIVPDPDPTKPPRFARIRLTGMVLCTNFAVTRPPHCVIVLYAFLSSVGRPVLCVPELNGTKRFRAVLCYLRDC